MPEDSPAYGMLPPPPLLRTVALSCGHRVSASTDLPPRPHSPQLLRKTGHTLTDSAIDAVSTGDMLRQAVADQTEVGKKAEKIMKEGGLVGDDIVVGIISVSLRFRVSTTFEHALLPRPQGLSCTRCLPLFQDRIKASDCSEGFMLDGFPRTVPQAKSLDGLLAASGESMRLVLSLEVPDDVLTPRCGQCSSL